LAYSAGLSFTIQKVANIVDSSDSSPLSAHAAFDKLLCLLETMPIQLQQLGYGRKQGGTITSLLSDKVLPMLEVLLGFSKRFCDFITPRSYQTWYRRYKICRWDASSIRSCRMEYPLPKSDYPHRTSQYHHVSGLLPACRFGKSRQCTLP
jgi:hypothetical protein